MNGDRSAPETTELLRRLGGDEMAYRAPDAVRRLARRTVRYRNLAGRDHHGSLAALGALFTAVADADQADQAAADALLDVAATASHTHRARTYTDVLDERETGTCQWVWPLVGLDRSGSFKLPVFELVVYGFASVGATVVAVLPDWLPAGESALSAASRLSPGQLRLFDTLIRDGVGAADALDAARTLATTTA